MALVALDRSPAVDPGILYYHKDERKSQTGGSSSVNDRTGELVLETRPSVPLNRSQGGTRVPKRQLTD